MINEAVNGGGAAGPQQMLCEHVPTCTRTSANGWFVKLTESLCGCYCNFWLGQDMTEPLYPPGAAEGRAILCSWKDQHSQHAAGLNLSKEIRPVPVAGFSGPCRPCSVLSAEGPVAFQGCSVSQEPLSCPPNPACLIPAVHGFLRSQISPHPTKSPCLHYISFPWSE